MKRRRRYRTLNGLSKKCSCERRRWSECRHPWQFGFMFSGTAYRFSLNKRMNKSWLSKSEADKLAEDCRDEIAKGTFDLNGGAYTGDTRLLFGDVADRYFKEYVPFINGEPGKPRRPGSVKSMGYMVKALKRVEIPASRGRMVTLADKPIADITTDDIKAIRTHWPLKTKHGSKGGTTAPDRNLKRLRHIFNWSIRNGIVESSPFKKAHLNVITFSKENGRTRRLEGDEEQRLLKAARKETADRGQVPWLEHLIVAALDTGCRRGELLTAQWSQVKWPEGKKRGTLFLPSVKTKTTRDRWIPITKPLLTILEMRKHAPDGTEHKPDCYVFGNAVGEARKDFKNCWSRVLKLSKVKDFHFHDLRREAASRWLESGVVPLHEISAWLGHADIQTTSIYLRITQTSLLHAADRLERFRDEQEDARKKSKPSRRRRTPTPPPPDSGVRYTIN
jgi:integrase